MKHNDFSIGHEFYTATGEWRCTDLGTRTIVAIKIDILVNAYRDDQGKSGFERVSDDQSWFNGPPYGVAEHVFDEYDMEGCYAELE